MLRRNVLIVAGAVTFPQIVFTIAALIATYLTIRFILAGIANLHGLRLIFERNQ